MTSFLLPPQPIAPEQLGQLADRLRAAVELFAGHGVTMGPGNRLQIAEAHLRGVQSHQQWPTNRDGLILTGNAIRLGFDMMRIGIALREGIPSGLRATMQRATGGRLSDVGASEAHQAQTEALWGTIAAAGGLLPVVPSGAAGKSPDFLLTARELSVAFEVKRLAKAASLERNLRGAIRQAVAFGVRHCAVVLDVSDIITPTSEESLVSADREAYVEEAFETIVQGLTGYLARQGATPPFDALVGLVVSADAFLWRRGPEGAPLPAARAFYHIAALGRGRAALVHPQAADVRDRLMSGMTELGGMLIEVRRVR